VAWLTVVVVSLLLIWFVHHLVVVKDLKGQIVLITGGSSGLGHKVHPFENGNYLIFQQFLSFAAPPNPSIIIGAETPLPSYGFRPFSKGYGWVFWTIFYFLLSLFNFLQLLVSGQKIKF